MKNISTLCERTSETIDEYYDLEAKRAMRSKIFIGIWVVIGGIFIAFLAMIEIFLK